MKKTAVEWLHERMFVNNLSAVFERAKQIEKEQIVDAFNSGMNHSIDYFIPENDTIEATEYYNKTYNNEAQTIR